MSLYALTQLARADIFYIWSHIAHDNEDAADRVERAIYDARAFVSEAPMRGHIKPGLTTLPLRFWTLTKYSNYTIVYRPETAPLHVIAILHGKRNIAESLKIAYDSEVVRAIRVSLSRANSTR